MKKLIIILVVFSVCACKKAPERGCFKGHGEEIQMDIALDSTNSFVLNKKMKFRLFEDTLNKVVLKGGANMLNMIDVRTEGFETTISNENSCHFLRDSERFVEVEIHYSNYRHLTLHTSDSVIFENTIASDSLFIQFFESGSSMILDVDNTFTQVIVSRGTADFLLSGKSQNSEVKVQDNGYANALDFRSPYMFAASSSTANLQLNLDSTSATVFLDGSGDILYTGEPNSLNLSGSGGGKLIKY